MSFREFFVQVEYNPTAEHARRGQHLVIELNKIRPDLAGQLTNDKDFDCFYKDFDCFYDDSRIPAFWAWVRENW